MPLLSITQAASTRAIPPAYIHPDRVALQFCYASPPDTTAYEAREALKAIVGGRCLSGMALRFNMKVPALKSPVGVKFTKPTKKKPFFFKVNLSPLNLLRSPFPIEHEKDGQLNYLSSRQVSEDNSFVASRLAEWVPAIDSILDRLADRLARRLRPNGWSSFLECRLHTIEMCADLGALDPGLVVNRTYPVIREHYKQTIQSGYKSAASYQGIDRDALMAWGFAQKGERIKAYEKSATRLRLECALDKHALDSVLKKQGRTRQLSSWDEIEVVCAALAQHAAGRFEPIVKAMKEVREERASPVRLVSLATMGMSANFAEQGLLLLGRNGRISSSFSQGMATTWFARGIVRRVARGQYAIAEQYRSALMSFVQLADSWAQMSHPPGS